MVYRLSAAARTLTLREWRRMGGCGISTSGEWQAREKLGINLRMMEERTLGEIEDASVVAGRGLARYAVERMGRPDLALIEYPDPLTVAAS